MHPKTQLHVSGLNLLSRCGIAFEYRYMKGLKLPPDVGLTIGKAVDVAVNTNMQAKVDTGHLLETEAVEALARDAVVAGFDEVEIEESYRMLGKQGARDKAVDSSVILSRLHHRQAAPKISPTHVQRQWVVDIDGLDIQVAGTIDIQEGSRSIRDTKTSKKS